MELTSQDSNHALAYTVIKGLLAILIIVSMWLAVQSIREAAPTQVVINAQNLTQSQYNEMVAKTAPYHTEDFFSMQLPAIHDTVLDLDWVSQAKVERNWQKGVVITAQPRVAIAKFGSEHFIDAEGHVFVSTDTNLFNNQMVTLQGDKSQSKLIMQNMQQVNEWFAPSGIKVQDMILTPRMTWLIRFDSGLRVIVDNENTTQKLSNLSYLMTNQLRPVIGDVASIDLRYKNGFAITWRPQPEVLMSDDTNGLDSTLDDN